MGKSARNACASSFTSAPTAMGSSYPAALLEPRGRVPYARVRVGPALAILVALVAGCGGGGGGDQASDSPGAKVFASAGCGGCHTYSPANSNGSVGPNLDDANVTFDQAVQQVTNGGGGMPPFKDNLSKQEIEDVARFVSQGSGSAAGAGGPVVGPFLPDHITLAGSVVSSSSAHG